MSWLSNVGKLMLTVAGLIALLDLAGPNGVAGWAGRAEKRHKETDERWAGLKAARRDEAR
ncbi:hypothetical protein MCAG_03915 [Micromonospora sp. ATCC 39149]|uniref:Uncharacterized protein n=1 Tax=Micromonospora carbonacea TaxID=47853 RepID=A0A7D6C854_9ACTN|nr:hypothetical protein [Micromonospora sp. ATCC 39149]EEP73588.1 hypothetical protein MCAG_03915 [Micromonospora sp. ATCC 39149]QLJ99507.1 hypothetical protein HZU44_05110 [Micromonospora carbonacea]